MCVCLLGGVQAVPLLEVAAESGDGGGQCGAHVETAASCKCSGCSSAIGHHSAGDGLPHAHGDWVARVRRLQDQFPALARLELLGRGHHVAVPARHVGAQQAAQGASERVHSASAAMTDRAYAAARTAAAPLQSMPASGMRATGQIAGLWHGAGGMPGMHVVGHDGHMVGMAMGGHAPFVPVSVSGDLGRHGAFPQHTLAGHGTGAVQLPMARGYHHHNHHHGVQP